MSVNEEEARIILGASRVIAQDITVIDRVVEILDCLEQHTLLSLTEIVRVTGIPKPTCHRLLQSMLYHHMVRREGRLYGIGSRLFAYVYSQLMNEPLEHVSRPVLKELRDATGLTTILCVRQGAFRVVVGLEEADQGERRFVGIGQVAVIYAGAPSKVLLAWESKAQRDAILSDIHIRKLTPHTIANRADLERECARIRRMGWALSVAEREPTAFSVSVPVADAGGRVAASLTVTGPITSFARAKVPQWVIPLASSGRQLSRALGYEGAYPLRDFEGGERS
ncbi:IclR family transcriptional regulator [Sulfobacillus harzensis]|uniref:IclR family transcriptional regulator n=1 Tax=Sulfobacillus harzensis TaxID=2729629 RepID=A0A7Y0L5Y5_9FIRM|nr:IclR family transcriptional regulator [Sulfobacillus harzensis]NMP23653.1 IclR family transcriptional regulator [Sulfobacillus harzensis]